MPSYTLTCDLILESRSKPAMGNFRDQRRTGRKSLIVRALKGRWRRRRENKTTRAGAAALLFTPQKFALPEISGWRKRGFAAADTLIPRFRQGMICW